MSRAPLVLVAHDSDGIRGVIEVLLRGAGFAVHVVSDGTACLRALAELAPAALVVDVALPDVHAFALIEEGRRRLPSLRIVLVASIYNRTSYKRRPTSLYGADDYVEQHHIPDSLVGKLTMLLGGAPPDAPAPMDARTERVVREAGEGRLAPAVPKDPSSAAAITRAERLARLIVTDIALYNGDALESPPLFESVDQLEARFRVDLEEGRVLFDLRVPAAVRKGRDFIGEALAELVREASRDRGRT